MCDGTGRAPENSCCTPWGGSHRGKDCRCARGPTQNSQVKIPCITASPVDFLLNTSGSLKSIPMWIFFSLMTANDTSSHPSTQKHRLLLQTRDAKEFANGWESWTRWLSWGEFQQALDPQKWPPRTRRFGGLQEWNSRTEAPYQVGSCRVAVVAS